MKTGNCGTDNSLKFDVATLPEFIFSPSALCKVSPAFFKQNY
jgi:hypothetical protein